MYQAQHYCRSSAGHSTGKNKPNITVDLVVVIPQVNVLYNYFYSHLCLHMEDLNFFITFRLEAGAKHIGMSCCVVFV